jgi:hypothetical protein
MRILPGMQRNRVIVLAGLLPEDSPIYRNWTDLLSMPYTIESGYDSTWSPPEDSGIIVTPQHYEEPEISLLREAAEAGIPTLVIADGILEYRNTWQNPTIVPGCIFQPVMSHKLAVIGASQARAIESWGNSGKCEVVGAPRLDDLVAIPPHNREGDQPFRILVTTARTPGFTPEQVLLVEQSLRDLKAWFDASDGEINGRAIKVQWRLTGGMAEMLGVESEIQETLGVEFHAMLREADAIVTTPSTTMLEGMLCGIPVVMLDYTNSPTYVPPAWAVTAREHLDRVMPELISPAEPRMQFQRSTLHDALECTSPAAPRMVKLVEAMVRIGDACRERHAPLCFPRRILDDTEHSVGGNTPPSADLAASADRVELEHLRRYVKSQDGRVRELQLQRGPAQGGSLISRVFGGRRQVQ